MECCRALRGDRFCFVQLVACSSKTFPETNLNLFRLARLNLCNSAISFTFSSRSFVRWFLNIFFISWNFNPNPNKTFASRITPKAIKTIGSRFYLSQPYLDLAKLNPGLSKMFRVFRFVASALSRNIFRSTPKHVRNVERRNNTETPISLRNSAHAEIFPPLSQFACITQLNELSAEAGAVWDSIFVS